MKHEKLIDRRRQQAIRLEVHDIASNLDSANRKTAIKAKKLARKQMCKISCNMNASARDLVTTGEFFVAVALAALPLLAIVGGIAAIVALLIKSTALSLAAFFAIAFIGGSATMNSCWNLTEKMIPWLYARFIAPRRLARLESDLIRIDKVIAAA